MVVAGIVAFAVFGYVYLAPRAQFKDDVVQFETLIVSGNVNEGADRTPVSLLFRDEDRGETENVSFEGTHYEIELPMEITIGRSRFFGIG